MANSSFDIVSKVERQEIDNALNQTTKELSQRYDFKGTGAAIEWSGEWAVQLRAGTEERVKAALDVFQSKLVRRGVSLKALETGEPTASGKEYRLLATFQAGLSSEQAKQVAALVRSEGPKGVKAQVQGDEVRVIGKSRDALQDVIGLLKAADLDFPLQFTNYR